MKTQCPSCRALYAIKPEFLGKRSACKNCGRHFTIEAAPEEGAASPSPPERTAPGPPAAPETWPANAPLQDEELTPDNEERPAQPEPAQPEPAASQPEAPWKNMARKGRAYFQNLRPPALVFAVAAGALVGAGSMGFLKDGAIERLAASEAAARRELAAQTRKLGEPLKKERENLREEIKRLEEADYPAGSIPRTLAEAAIIEYKTADALLTQRIAAAGGGARLTMTLPSAAPNPQLAAALEAEITRLKAEIEARRLEVAALPPAPRTVAQTALATEEINLAILNRNRLMAQFGLSSAAAAGQ